VFPVPPVAPELYLAPPPDPPGDPFFSGVQFCHPPYPPPVDVIGEGEFAKIEGLPEVPAALGDPPVPPAPTVTEIGLAGTDNFVPPGKEVRYPPAPPPPAPVEIPPAPPPATTLLDLENHVYVPDAVNVVVRSPRVSLI
jgi:hypothetical protein